MRFAFFLAALVAFAPGARAQWVQQSPHPHGNLVHDIGAPAPGVALLLSDDSEWDDPRGPLFRTTDGGATWADVPLPNQFGLYDIFFLGQNGWAVGDENYRTTDGGQTWTPMPFLGSTYHVEFFTPTFGYAVSNGGLYISRNGGAQWSFSPGESYAFSFRDDHQVGLAGGAEALRRTTNGGQSFSVVRTGETYDVQFLTDVVAIALINGQVSRSTDAGQTWTDVASAFGTQVFLRFSETAVVAYYPQYSFPGPSPVIRTGDGGQTWSNLGTPVPGGIHRAEVLDAQTAVAVTPMGQVWRSTDAGQTWAFAFAAPTVGCDRIAAECVWGLDFANATEGWLVGGNGLILKTTDGGVSWDQVSNGYGAGGDDIAMFDAQRLIVPSSEVLLTENAGARWVLVEDDSEPYGNTAVQTLDDSVAVMLSYAELVQRTFDGGHTWTAGNPVPDPGFVVDDKGDLHFRTPTDGWVVGRDVISPYSHNVWHTTDGGETWTLLEAPGMGGQVWVGVDFEGERGWIVSGVQVGGGQNARVLRTEDGGATWILDELPDSYAYNMNDIEFFDENTGYVVGWFGYAAKSTDGGDTWTVLDIPPAPPGSPSNGYTMWDLHLTSPTDVWVVTSEDVVLHSTDGGTTWQERAINSRPEAFGAFTGIVATPEGDVWVAGFGGHIYALGVSVAEEPPAPAAPAAALALSAMAPNPASGRTRFAISLSQGQRVEVEVFDALGRRVAVLHEGTLAAGTHPLVLDASVFAPGVYVVRATASDGARAMRRLVVVR